MARKFIQAGTFNLYGAGATIGDTSIILSSFNDVDGTAITGSNIGDLAYGTLEPNNASQEEQISFTGITSNANGSVTLTGVKTVLMVSPYTETSGIVKNHPGASVFVLSNTAGYYNQFAVKANDETITGSWTFSSPSASGNPATKSYVDTNFLNKVTASAQTVVAPTTFSDAVTVPATPVAATDAASKGYVDGVAVAGAPNASTTIKGIVEEALSSETNAGTTTGGTGARLYVNPSTLITYPVRVAQFDSGSSASALTFWRGDGQWVAPAKPSCVTLVPLPNGLPLAGTTQFATNNDTRFYVGQIVVPFEIVVNKLSFVVTAFGSGAGTIKIALFSEDGQTQLFSITTASVSGTGIVTTAVPAVTVSPGVYYLGFVSSNTDITFGTWDLDNGTTFGALANVSGEPLLTGRQATASNTVPATITPGSLTAASKALLSVRLDN